MKKISVILLCLALLSSPLVGSALGREVPALKGRVNDYAGILSAPAKNHIEQLLVELENSDSTQLVVLTIKSLQGDSLEQFSLRVVESWKIGQSGLDNGALLLIAVEDRKVRIEVGYGLEGKLTDLMAGRIIRNVILPQFKQGDFDQGVIGGVNAMIATVRGEYSNADQIESGSSQNDYMGLVALMMFFFFFLGNILRRKKAAGAIVGGIGAPLLGGIFQGFSLPLFLLLIPVGLIGGLIVSALPVGSGRSGRLGGVYIGSGGFGSSSGGFGGFSGGGGGFGGGGASGGW